MTTTPNPAPDRLTFGDRVTITGQVQKRRHAWRREVSYHDAPPPHRSVDSLERDKRGHKTNRWTTEHRPLTEGIVIGKRTLQNGNWDWEDGYSIYTPRVGEKCAVYVVAVAMDRRPIYCRPEQIEKVKEDE